MGEKSKSMHHVYNLAASQTSFQDLGFFGTDTSTELKFFIIFRNCIVPINSQPLVLGICLHIKTSHEGTGFWFGHASNSVVQNR